MRRFSLRTLLVVVTLLAIGLGYHVHLVGRQREVVAVIHDLGGLVEYRSPLPHAMAEWMGFDRVGYVTWVRMRQPFVHLALQDLQSLRSLQALEVACLESQREHIDGSLFDEVAREALPGVSVDYVNEKWFFQPVPKAISDGLPEKIDGRVLKEPFFVRTDALRTNDGSLRYVLWDEYQSAYVIAVLMDQERVLDWKVGNHESGALVHGLVEDVDGDDQADVAFRIFEK
jgi:hypothetical protein